MKSPQNRLHLNMAFHKVYIYSCLGPTLFIFNINEVFKIIYGVKVMMFEDLHKSWDAIQPVYYKIA